MSYITDSLNVFPNGTATDGQADEALAVDSTVGGVQFSAFETTINIRTTEVLLDVQDADVRFTIDGSAPTSSNGHILYAGDMQIWDVKIADAAKFIRKGAVDAVIHVSQLVHSG